MTVTVMMMAMTYSIHKEVNLHLSIWGEVEENDNNDDYDDNEKVMIWSELVLPVCWWAWCVITDENGVDGEDNDDRKSHPPAFWWARWMMMITMMRMVTIMTTGSELVPPASVSFEVSLGKFPMQVKIWPRQTIVARPEHGDVFLEWWWWWFLLCFVHISCVSIFQAPGLIGVDILINLHICA